MQRSGNGTGPTTLTPRQTVLYTSSEASYCAIALPLLRKLSVHYTDPVRKFACFCAAPKATSIPTTSMGVMHLCNLKIAAAHQLLTCASVLRNCPCSLAGSCLPGQRFPCRQEHSSRPCGKPRSCCMAPVEERAFEAENALAISKLGSLEGTSGAVACIPKPSSLQASRTCFRCPHCARLKLGTGPNPLQKSSNSSTSSPRNAAPWSRHHVSAAAI